MRRVTGLLLALELVLGIAAPPAAAADGPSTRPAAPPATLPSAPAISSDDQKAVKQTMKNFLAEAGAGRYDGAANRFCHARDSKERLLAMVLGQFYFSQNVCRRRVEQGLGSDVAREVFDIIGADDVDRARIVVKGNVVTLVVKGAARFPVVKVDDGWKFSMAGFCAQEHAAPMHLVPGYLQMTLGYSGAAQDVINGKCSTAAEVKDAIRRRTDEAGERVWGKAKQNARAE